jgi:hypothetical protein
MCAIYWVAKGGTEESVTSYRIQVTGYQLQDADIIVGFSIIWALKPGIWNLEQLPYS